MRINGYLLDENLPSKLPFSLEGIIVHANELGISVSDQVIWNYCKENSLAIITKDSDFSERILISEPPPKVIHLEFGNMKLQEFNNYLESIWSNVENLLIDSKLVNVYEGYVEFVR